MRDVGVRTCRLMSREASRLDHFSISGERLATRALEFFVLHTIGGGGGGGGGAEDEGGGEGGEEGKGGEEGEGGAGGE